MFRPNGFATFHLIQEAPRLSFRKSFWPSRISYFVSACLFCLLLQLIATSVKTSASWDEGHHLFDGYVVLKYGDFALNPEVPPLAKSVAAFPLLSLTLYEPKQQGRSSQFEAFVDGKDFLFRNNANELLFRARFMIAMFTLALAYFTYLLGRCVFGTPTALVALALLTFDPTLLAHGALVTTDAALSCFIVIAVLAWVRYIANPSALRLACVGLAMGLALATKFTGLFLLPIFVTLAALEAIQQHSARLLFRRLGAISIAGLTGYVALWSAYGFRYAARPNGLALNPTLENYVSEYARIADPHALAFLARFHLLPEAYIWGLANTKLTEFRNVSYLFGEIHRHGTWLYFPAAIVIKSTLPLLASLVLAAWSFARRREIRWRVLMLLTPVTVFLAIAMHSDMNIGIRHILPVYPFFYLIGASALVAFFGRRPRSFQIALVLLVGFQATTSLRCFPAYIAYANEAWGGPQGVSRYLSDSNSDWGQQLKTANTWLKANHVSDCWFAYTASGVVDEHYYGISCRPLPTTVNLWWIPVPMNVPTEIQGTVLISDDQLRGIDLPFGTQSPYAKFLSVRPVAILDGGLFVYQGTFDITAASTQAKIASKVSPR